MCWKRLLIAGALVFVILNSQIFAKTFDAKTLRGGPYGVVRTTTGFPIEGIMVQLISLRNSIRTTVYTNDTGYYEFPTLEGGSYTLRIPRPLEFKRYQRESIQIAGRQKLADIVLERVTNSEFLPPTADILTQLSDAEWLYNLPGTAQEKKTFGNTCGVGCHTYQNQFRARLDENGWKLILHRMLDFDQRILVQPKAQALAEGGGLMNGPSQLSDREIILKWLTRVRGPDSQNPSFKPFPRPQGPATRAVITEYELPWSGVNVHDVAGDQKGNIWFTINRSPFIGKLDPKTGVVVSYRTPDTPGKHPGGHWIRSTSDGKIWYSETWTGNLVRFDPATGDFRVMHTGLQGNMALGPDGSLWRTDKGAIHQYDTGTGNSIRAFPMKGVTTTYGNFISADGKYFGGANREADFDGVVWMDMQTKEVRVIPTISGVAQPSRGNFDKFDNIWAGGRGGVLVKYDPKANTISEYAPPTPFNTFYEATPDKNGDIWAGEMRAGRMARFNPRTTQWIEYVLPEPYSFDWNTYVDNSTDPVTVWYGDQYGYIVRIQPLE